MRNINPLTLVLTALGALADFMISWRTMLTAVMVAALIAFLIIFLLAMKKVSGHPTKLPAGPAPQTGGMLLEWLAPVYDRYCPRIGLGRAFRLMTLARAGLKPGERVLDVGCGTGVLTRLAAEAVGPAGRVIGIDPGPKMIGIAKKNAGMENSRAGFELGAIENLPFEECSFDCVLSSFMMHHLPPELKHKGLREVYRVLKPEGRLLIVDIGRPSNPLWWVLAWPLLSWRFTKDQIAGKLDKYIFEAGFHNVKIVGEWKGLMSFWLAIK